MNRRSVDKTPRAPIIDDETVRSVWEACGRHVTLAADRLGYTTENVRQRLKAMGLTLQTQRRPHPPRVSDEELIATFRCNRSVQLTTDLLGYQSERNIRRRLVKLGALLGKTA